MVIENDKSDQTLATNKTGLKGFVSNAKLRTKKINIPLYDHLTEIKTRFFKM
jgi:hypothetical protein